MRNTTLLLANDHPLVREGIRSILNTRDEIEVIDEVSTGEEVLRLSIELRPDLAILEVGAQKLDTLQVIRNVRRQQKQTRFLLLSMRDNVYQLLEAIRAGASGCLLKRSSAENLLEAIDVVRAGKVYLEPLVAADIATTLARPPEPLRSWSKLSHRELEVFKLTAGGYSSKEIGSRAYVSIKTINSHRGNLMKKLEIHEVTHLVRYAIREGIVAL